MKKLEKFVPYKAALHEIWNKSIEERADILKLDWNEATCPPSPKVIERVKELADMPDFYQWYPNINNEHLNERIADYIGVTKQNIQIFHGSDELHECIAKAYVDKGDNVLLLWPTYDNFRSTIELAKGNIYYSVMPNFKFSVDILTEDIEQYEPELIYICNPNNPTGELIPEEILLDLLNRYQDRIFVIDEAYAEFSFQTIAKYVTRFPNILVTRTFSKAFALANFRIGYLIAEKDNIDYISLVRNSKSISTFAQEAALAALSDCQYMEKYIWEVKKAKEYFVGELKSMNSFNVYPSEANFVMIELKNKNRKNEFFIYMRSHNIYIRNLMQTVFEDRFVRISIGTRAQMERVVKCMKEFDARAAYENSSF